MHCAFHFDRSTYKYRALWIFQKMEMAGEAEDGSLSRLRGSCHNKSGCKVIGLLSGLGWRGFHTERTRCFGQSECISTHLLSEPKSRTWDNGMRYDSNIFAISCFLEIILFDWEPTSVGNIKKRVKYNNILPQSNVMVGKPADEADIVRDESLIGSFRMPAIRAQPEGAVSQVNSLNLTTYLHGSSHPSLKRQWFPVRQQAKASDEFWC